LATLQAAIAERDRQAVVFDAKSMNQHLGLAVAPLRLAANLLLIFGGLALCLAIVGLHGVVSYAAVRRTKEIGIRLALGARRTDVIWLIIRQGFVQVAVGVVFGLAIAFGITRLLRGMLYGVSATDALAFGGATSTLLVIGAIACYLPARKASRVEAVVALRHE
jgi:putative ABC transport system permease protein